MNLRLKQVVIAFAAVFGVVGAVYAFWSYKSSMMATAYLEVAPRPDLSLGIPRSDFVKLTSAKPHGFESPKTAFVAKAAEQIDAVLVFNPETSQVYFSKNQFKKVPVASLTKLMTAIVVKEGFDLSRDQLIVKEELAPDLDSLIEFKVGDRVSARDCMHAMIQSSNNDCSYIFATNYEGGLSAFLGEMNRRALEFGMVDSSFTSPAGFDLEGNYSTAADLKVLVKEFMKDEELMKIARRTDYYLNYRSVSDGFKEERIFSTNRLLGVDRENLGLKTGTTDDAGECFIGYFKGSDGRPVVTIVLNDKGDRFGDSRALYDAVKAAF